MSQFYLIDSRRALVSGPHPINGQMPADAYATNTAPPTPGEGETVIAGLRGAWKLVPTADLRPAPAIVGPARLHRGSFATDLLIAAENDAWIDLVDAAAQTAPASRTQTQKDVLRAWRHFTLHEYIDRDNAFTQAAVMALYVWGVLGPVKTSPPETDPTPEEAAAIARADRIGRFLPPE